VEAKRRQVTVLFTDMVGFTTFSEQAGEEAAFTLMRSLSELMDGAVHEYGGVRANDSRPAVQDQEKARPSATASERGETDSFTIRTNSDTCAGRRGYGRAGTINRFAPDHEARRSVGAAYRTPK
jgi:class 3 adenylate cyclase